MAIRKKLECGHTVELGMLNWEKGEIVSGYCQRCHRTSAIVADESTLEWTEGRIAGAMSRYAPPKGRPEHRDDGGDPNPGFGIGE